ncbi:ankyrin repeat-containing domain protein [Halenospora varia]|nr:ankyrin repeat-containing domain protein [Halenospora varia]
MRDLDDIDRGCRKILDELQQILDKYSELSSEALSVSRRIKRVWKRLKWDPDDIEDLRSRINTNIGFLTAFNGRLTRDNVVNDFISRRQEGTGQWLLDSDKFQAWVKTDKQTLFCPGIPGAGKTILTSIVIEELINCFHDNKNICIAYLYFNFRRQYDQKIDNLRTRPSRNEILMSLQALASMYSRVFIIIDALDECPSYSCRTRFLSEMFTLQARCVVNLFATSRFIPEITKKFQGGVSLEIRASEDDIRRYIEGQISHLPSFIRRNPDLQEEVKTGIVNVVDGMFLLAQLHLDSLVGKRSPKAVRAALKALPSGSNAYDHAYKEAMIRIEGQMSDQGELAKQALSWITCANRPLTTLELQHALAVEMDESELDEENLLEIEQMVSVCAGLVTVDEESHVIRLVHYTTQEYFERMQSHWFPNAETNITATCIAYLSFDVFTTGFCQTNKFTERLWLNPFFDYASRNWGHHARKTSNLKQDLGQAIIDFLENEDLVNASVQGFFDTEESFFDMNYFKETARQMTSFDLVVYFELTAVASLLFEQGTNPDSRIYCKTPLVLAAMNGREALVKILLKQGVKIDSKDSEGRRTPLSYAAEYGRVVVIKLLLENGPEMDSKDIKYGRTPLSWAAGNNDMDIYRILHQWTPSRRHELRPIIQVEDTEETEDTMEAVVRLLLQKGADLDPKDLYSRTPLSYAAENGCEAVVEVLLDSGAEVESMDKCGETPLSLAYENGHEATVKLLLEKGAEELYIYTYSDVESC